MSVPDHMYVDESRPHLGGYIKGGDPGSYCPDLWRWLVEEQDVRSMIDVGCGEGHALRFFEELGVDVIGIDGIEQEHEQIVCHDYTTGSWPQKVLGTRLEAATDLVWCCEFVEHVEEEYVPNFLETFLMARIVLMTHAQPGQGGHHHVNCQTDYYWIERMDRIDFHFDLELTRQTHALVSPSHYYAWSGLAFVQ